MRVVMFVRNDVLVDARVLKEAGSLAGTGHDVTIIGITRPGTEPIVEREEREGFAIVRVPMPRWNRWWRWFRAPSRLWSRIRHRRGAPGSRMDGLDWLAMWRFGNLGWARAAAREAGPADVYHGHDLTGLPAAVEARRMHSPDARLVYDSHELFIESGATAGRPSWAVEWLARRERAWASEADALVTVNRALADVLGPRLGMSDVVIVHNCPPLVGAREAATDLLRGATGIPASARIVLYHGGLRPGRGLTNLADAMLEPGMESAHLVFLGFGPAVPGLRQVAAEARFGGRIHVLDPVPPDEVVDWVHGADVEAIPFEAVSRNNTLGTPNKMFEALAAGVPVAASDLPGIRSVLIDDPLGPLGELFDPSSPASISRAILRILELPADGWAELSSRCLTAARERWNWETESARLIELYSRLGAAR